jgi:hypothetical protein
MKLIEPIDKLEILIEEQTKLSDNVMLQNQIFVVREKLEAAELYISRLEQENFEIPGLVKQLDTLRTKIAQQDSENAVGFGF